MSKCPIAESVAREVITRSEVGFKKYGVTADRDDLNNIEWLQHLKEELLDAAVYITKLQKELKANPMNPASPCPECGYSCVLIGTQQLKVCTSCDWKDKEWTLSKEQRPIYG